MAFVNGIWVEEPNNDAIQGKIELTPSNITITPTTSRENRGRYELLFNFIIHGRDINLQDPTIFRRIDRKNLMDSVLGVFDKNELKYYDYVFKGSRELKLIFDHEKWFEDVLRGVNPRGRSSFTKEFHLRKRLPRLLAYTDGRDYLGSFLAKKFEKHLNDRKYQRFFRGVIPKEYERHIRKNISSMMEYEYNFSRNIFTSRLKSVYILGILYAVNKLTDKVDDKSYFLRVGKDKDFTKRVKGKSKSFDNRKWREFIKRRYI